MITLRDFERLYRATGNPLYVWVALDRHDFCPDGAPLPGWIMTYLREAAMRLEELANTEEPARALKRVNGVLGLSAKGRNNKFAAWRLDRRAEAAAFLHDQGRDMFADEGKPWSGRRINEWLAKSTRANVTDSTVGKWKERGKRFKSAE
jgi:hypothetical protein